MSKVVFITGATAGFGAACARRFAREGWSLVLTGRRADRLEALKAELSALVPVHVAVMDVREAAQVQAVVEALPLQFSTVHTLVNNAGLALGLDPAQSASLDDWQTMIDTNITGMTTCTRLLLPRLIATAATPGGAGATVINLGSIAGTYPYPGGNVYGATKAFVHQFSLNLRTDLHGTGVRVTCIEPGHSESEFSLVRFKGDADRAKALYAGIEPLRPEDIAETVFWAVSLPPHVNINRLEVMPVCQSSGPLRVHRPE